MVFFFWALLMANATGWGTLVAGWAAVPVSALVAGWAAPKGARPLVSVPLGAVLGWGALLLLDARSRGFASLIELLGQLLPVRAPLVAVATLGLALLLSLGAAMLGAALRRRETESSTLEVGS